MDKVVFRQGNRVKEVPQLLWKRLSSFRRHYASDAKDTDELDKGKMSEEELKKLRQGPMQQDKQQSLQEESYFHKEEREKLRLLKKKMDEKPKKEGKGDD